jgi:hypothetical protein
MSLRTEAAKGAMATLRAKAIEHWLDIALVFSASGAMAWLSSFSEQVSAYGPFGYGVVAAVTMIASVTGYYLLQLAGFYRWNRGYLERAARSQTVNVRAPSHINSRMHLYEFYHPGCQPVPNVLFENCDLIGPSAVLLKAGQTINCTFIDCEIVVMSPKRRTKCAVTFQNCQFVRCTFYRVVLLISVEQYHFWVANNPEICTGTPVISDGTVGEL